MDSDRRLSWFYLWPPIAVAATIGPLVAEMPGSYLSIPFYLGLVSAPGYVYAWYRRGRSEGLSKVQTSWIRVSLMGAVAASVGGLTSLLTVIVFPFVVLTLLAAVILLARFNGVSFLNGRFHGVSRAAISQLSAACIIGGLYLWALGYDMSTGALNLK